MMSHVCLHRPQHYYWCILGASISKTGIKLAKYSPPMLQLVVQSTEFENGATTWVEVWVEEDLILILWGRQEVVPGMMYTHTDVSLMCWVYIEASPLGNLWWPHLQWGWYTQPGSVSPLFSPRPKYVSTGMNLGIGVWQQVPQCPTLIRHKTSPRCALGLWKLKKKTSLNIH